MSQINRVGALGGLYAVGISYNSDEYLNELRADIDASVGDTRFVNLAQSKPCMELSQIKA